MGFSVCMTIAVVREDSEEFLFCVTNQKLNKNKGACHNISSKETDFAYI
jgi:hypothetical protein